MATGTGTRRAVRGTAPIVPGRSRFLAPDVPELVELVDSAERALRARAEDQAARSESAWWVGLAAMGAMGVPIPPSAASSSAGKVRDELEALDRVRGVLTPALHDEPAAAMPYWRGPDREPLVAFRVVTITRDALDVLTVAARRLRTEAGRGRGDRAALACLLAVLIPVHGLDAAVLAAVGDLADAQGDLTEVVLDESARRAHGRVATLLLDALHQIHQAETGTRDREDDR
jgi:hypothetical protein